MKYARCIAAFALLSAGPVFAQSQGRAEAGNPDKVICKRLVETGSLVRKPRSCKTRATWEREGEAARKQVQEIQDSTLINSSRPN
ncbi:MAG: hypothetical protein ACXW27_01165 [Allosphingosinicella sp.]